MTPTDSPTEPGQSGEPAPRVSVLVPAYNAERYLADAIASVLTQTLTDFELVVVDDGSSDGTAEILSGLAVDEPRLRVLTQPNQGIAAALNNGLEICRAPLVARMDADDLMVPERLATQVTHLASRPELGFCSSAITMIDDQGREIGSYAAPITSLDELNKRLDERSWFSFTHPAVTFRRDDVIAAGGYTTSFEPCEDLDLFLRLIENGRPGIDLPQQLLRYRLHGASVSGANALKQIKMRRLVFDNFYRRRDGRPERTYEEFLASPEGGGWRARWNDRADALQAVGKYQGATGRPLRGRALITVALLLKVHRVPRRLVRALGR